MDKYRSNQSYFNPLPSCEGRPDIQRKLDKFIAFQSTPLMRGETGERGQRKATRKFQSTPLMRGETFCDGARSLPGRFQSTPLMRGETGETLTDETFDGISIHSPHARGDV